MGLSIFQEDVNEGDDLQCLTQPHAVSKNAPKAAAGLIPLQRLNEVIIEKPDSPNLRFEDSVCEETSWNVDWCLCFVSFRKKKK